jgi:hypothetical protein
MRENERMSKSVKVIVNEWCVLCGKENENIHSKIRINVVNENVTQIQKKNSKIQKKNEMRNFQIKFKNHFQTS